MQEVRTSIITIGDELLIGQVIDTNSAWMAQELNKAGIWVSRRVAVGDSWEAIWQTLDAEAAQADIVLITGGLGPTADDITKPLLANYFGGTMITDPGALANVKHIFETVLKRPMIERNLKQAEVPDCCTVIPNHRGTAPGMWFEKNDTIFVSMPGVPHEMKGMMTDDVIPALAKRFELPTILHRTLLTVGVGESFLADMINQFETGLPPHIKLAYLPNYGMVRLRLTSHGKDADALAKELDKSFVDLQQLVAPYLVTNQDQPMQDVVAALLLSRGATLSTAESCTGGYIAHLITEKPGASRYFSGSIVSYANQVKEALLEVPASVLQTEGAVSESTVKAMVRGALKQLHTDYALAVSGIMGPDGGTETKPVGTVWIAAGNTTTLIAERFQFRFDRQRNIQLTAMQALNLLRRFILEQDPAASQPIEGK